MSGTRMRYPVSNFNSDFFGVGVTCNEWSYCSHRCFIKWSCFAGSWTWAKPFFFFWKNGEDRTRDLTVHNLTFCLRRHCEEVDWKCYPTKCYSSCCLLNSFFLRNRHSKSSTMVRRFRWKNSIFAFFILNRPVAGAPRLVCKKNHANNKHSRVRLF